MKKMFTIKATLRDDIGKGASRRLRRADKVPGIVYGANKSPTAIILVHHELLHMLEQESFYTKILDLEIDGNKEQVIIRDLQRHPFKAKVLHLDLQRINATEKIMLRIPLHFSGEDIAPGVKVGGGIISHLLTDIEVRCLPGDLPEFIAVDLSNLELNQTVHLSDLKVPATVEVVSLSHGENKAVATAYIPRAILKEADAPVAAAAVPVIGEEEKTEDGTAVEGDAGKGKGEAKSPAGSKDK